MGSRVEASDEVISLLEERRSDANPKTEVLRQYGYRGCRLAAVDVLRNAHLEESQIDNS